MDKEISKDDKSKTFGKKIRTAFYGAIIFFVLSLPMIYNLTNNLWTSFTSNTPSASNFDLITEAGAPTMKGIVFHGIIFMIVLLFI